MFQSCAWVSLSQFSSITSPLKSHKNNWFNDKFQIKVDHGEFITPGLNDKVEGLENSGNGQDNKKVWMGLSIIWSAVIKSRIRITGIKGSSLLLKAWENVLL